MRDFRQERHGVRRSRYPEEAFNERGRRCAAGRKNGKSFNLNLRRKNLAYHPRSRRKSMPIGLERESSTVRKKKEKNTGLIFIARMKKKEKVT